ncbi:MAG: ABC transporter ATP-binding protein [Hyphomonadaceae bacterium]|nr:ABC transporter ATP-binding protein [Hyphomonadaceae bacterium]
MAAKIKLDNASFKYPIYALASRSLKVSMFRQATGGSIGDKGGVVYVQALSNISFELSPGDRLGIIGRNGSGKSTMLRVLAGLAHPQSGTVTVEGRVVPLIEKALGINPELSGYANIELPLRLLGATRAEVKKAQQEIPEFCGLGRFIHLPFRTYSDGMKTRLAFAISTALQADILVLDEWLAAGDLEFQERAEVRLTKLLDDTEIVVLASHAPQLIEYVCNKTLWMHGGEMVMLGPTREVLEAYQRSTHNPISLAYAATG